MSEGNQGLELENLSALPQTPAVDLDFEDISYAVPYGWRRVPKTILHSVSGRFRSGELSAILGASGSGKTSLLNVLTGYRSAGVTGSVRVNGDLRNVKQFHKLSCYIIQNDLHQCHLTAEEGITIAANFKLGNTLTTEEKSNLVTEIIKTLGLEHCRQTMTERLSGGERKRLSVALELVNNPPVVFLDEPTSGLDCLSTSHCISMLRTLAHQGRTIVCTIHQPSASIFRMFDRVYFLAGGCCVYQGSPHQLVPFLSSAGVQCPLHYNPADYMIEITHSDMPDNVVAFSTIASNGKQSYTSDNFSLGIESNDMIVKQPADSNVRKKAAVKFDKNDDQNSLHFEFATSSWMQFTILMKRLFLQTRRNLYCAEPGRRLRQEHGARRLLSKDNTGLAAFQERRSLLLLALAAYQKPVIRVELLRMLPSFGAKTPTAIQLGYSTFCGLSVGVIFFRIGNDAAHIMTIIKFIVAAVVILAFNHLTILSMQYPFEMKLLKREYFNRWYGLKAYYMAFTVMKIPVHIVMSIIFGVVTYTMTGQPMEVQRCLQYTFICLLLGLISESIGWLIGSIFNSLNGVVIGSTTLGVLLLIAMHGLDFARYVSTEMWIIEQCSYLRLGIMSIVLSLYGEGRKPLDCSLVVCLHEHTEVLMRDMALETTSYLLQVAGLFANLLLFRGLCYFSLRWRLHGYRSSTLCN